MIETEETGQMQLNELMRHKDSSVFNEWEQNFLKDIFRSKQTYSKLTKHQKAVITRLYGWLRGQ